MYKVKATKICKRSIKEDALSLQYEILSFANHCFLQWQLGEYRIKPVSASFYLPLLWRIRPEAKNCWAYCPAP
jgi:hypothetical protein